MDSKKDRSKDSFKDKNEKGDEDMAIIQNDVKSRLSELKKRATVRKNNPNLKHVDSQASLKRMSENAKLMYDLQMDTIKETD